MQNRNVYLSIAAVFVVLLAAIFYLESQRLSPENLEATIDARIAMAMEGQDATIDARLALAQEGQNDEEILSTIEAQRPLVLTDVALAYPSETATVTPTVTLTPSPTSLIPPTFTLTPTSAPPQLRAYPNIQIIEDITNVSVLAVDTQGDYFAVASGRTIRFYDIHSYRLLDDIETSSPITHLVWSPIDDRIASAHEDGSVFIFRINEDTAVLSLSFDSALSDLIWSPDGTLLLTALDNRLTLWNLDGTISKELELGLAPRIAWGNMFRPIFIVDSNGAYTFNPAFESATLDDISNFPVPIGSFDFAFDGLRLAYSTTENELIIRILSVSQPAATLNNAAPIISVDWSPDSDKIVTTDEANVLRVRNASSGSTQIVLEHNARLFDAQWTADSERVFVHTDYIYVIELPEE